MKTRIILTLLIYLTAGLLVAQTTPPKQRNLAKYHAWIELKVQMGVMPQKGQIRNLTETTLLFQSAGKQAGNELLIPVTNIEYIELRKADKPWIGLAIGMTGGALLGAGIGGATYRHDEEDLINFRGLAVSGGALIGGIAGGVAGVLIGAHKNIYHIDGQPQAFLNFRQKYGVW